MTTPTTSILTESTQALRRELDNAREQTDRLFDLLSPGTLYERPIAERHRLIFYLGHFEAFDWNVLARRGLSAPAFHAGFDQLFERGIDPPPGEAPRDSAHDWPSEAEVLRYRDQTRSWIDSHLDDFDPWLLNMTIEHRHMHAETFAYLMHGLPYDQKKFDSAGEQTATSHETPANPMVSVSASVVTLGKRPDTFGWDNEHLAHQVDVGPFRISKFKISNGEYLEFVREGGIAPHFWSRKGNDWLYRGMFSQFPLPLDWPVWVTWEQAFAYAAWRGLSLPSEAQFQRASQLQRPDATRDNFDYQRWDPIPVNASASDSSSPVQLTGNGWEWTRDVFAPFKGFWAHPFYPGYSADFFDGRHYVMKGASPRTARLLTRPSFRNWFRPDYPHMYAGFRLVDLNA